MMPTQRQRRFAREARFLAALMWFTSSTTLAQQASTIDTSLSGIFGPRLQTRPLSPADIQAPVWLAKAPTNEATMVRLRSGEIRVFFIDRPGTGHRLMSTGSMDEGLTWSAEREEARLAGEAYYAQQVYEDPNGTLHAVYHVYGTGPFGYRGRHLDLWYMQKPAGGEWSASKRIFYGYVGSVRSLIGLKDGRLLISMYEADTARASKPVKGTPDYGLFGVITLWSDDGGAHWQKSSQRIDIEVDPDQVTRYGAVEPVTIELEDGRLWMLIRTNKGHLFETYSTDRGEHWQPAVRSRFVSSDSPAGFLKLSDGRIVMFSNACQRYDNPRSYANGGREVLHAAICRPDRSEWQGFREVLVGRRVPENQRGDRGTAYPSAVETSNGKVLFISGQGADASIAAFDPDWLMARQHKDPTGANPVWWTRHGTDTGDHIFNFPISRTGRLSIRMAGSVRQTPLLIGLTDHFSIAADTAAMQAAPLYIRIEGHQLNKIQNRILIRWDDTRDKVRVRVNGHRKGLEHDIRGRWPAYGFNYLRINQETDQISMRKKK
jgi:BNR repeat-like domain